MLRNYSFQGKNHQFLIESNADETTMRSILAEYKKFVRKISEIGFLRYLRSNGYHAVIIDTSVDGCQCVLEFNPENKADEEPRYVGVKLEGASVDVFRFYTIQEGIDHANEIYDNGKNFDADSDGFIIWEPQEGTNEMKAVFSYEQDVMNIE